MNIYEGLVLLTLQENSNIFDMGGIYVGLFEDEKTNSKWHIFSAPIEFCKKCYWQKDNLNLNNTSHVNGFDNCYNIEDTSDFMAIDYCKSFNFYNFNDYYLPSIYELRFIQSKNKLNKRYKFWASTEFDKDNVYTQTSELITPANKFKEAYAYPIRRILIS